MSRLRSVELRRGKQVSVARRRKAQGTRQKAQSEILPHSTTPTNLISVGAAFPARLALLAWRAWWRAGSRDSSFRKPPQARLRRGIQGSRPEDARLPARLRPVGDYAPEGKAYSSERRTFILFALAALPPPLELRRDKPLSPAPQTVSTTSGFPVSQSAVGGFMNYPGYAQDLPRDEGSLALSSP